MKKKIDILSFKKNQIFLNTKKKYLNILSKNPTSKYQKNLSFPKYQAFSRKELINIYDTCENLFNIIIVDLSQKLNSFHKVNYSYRAWNIIIGTWLFDYIHASYKNYLELKYIKKNYRMKQIEIENYEKYNFTTNNSEEFQKILATTEWYLNFNSLLHEYFNSKNIKIKKNNNLRIKKFNYTPKIRKKKNFFLDIVYKFYNFFQSQNRAFISHTGLPFLAEKKLEIILKQTPSLYIQPKFNSKDRNIKTREYFSFISNEKKATFENFIKQNLKFFIPTSFIENFTELKKISKSKIFPQKTNLIFTSYLYAYDEPFKIYVAEQIEKKNRYYIGQHGNNYFTKIHTNYLPEIKNCNKFISWGHVEKPKVVGLFNFRTLKKNKQINVKRRKLTIIFKHLTQSGNDIHFNKQDHIENIYSILSIIKKLSKDIQKDVVLRLNESFYKDFYGIKCIDFFKNANVEIDPGFRDLESMLVKTKLCLFNYDSTGFLHNTLKNIPSITKVEKNFLNSINKKFEKKYQSLIDNKIMFDEEKNVITHINNNWSSINSWWGNKKTQKAINNFNHNLNISAHSKSILDIKKAFK